MVSKWHRSQCGFHLALVLMLLAVSECSLSWPTIEGCEMTTSANGSLEVSCTNVSIPRVVEQLPLDVTRLSFFNSLENAIDSPLFANLTSLDYLSLENCSIASLGPAAFQGLSQLRTLKLRKNVLQSLGEETFLEIPNLEILDVSYNRLVSIYTTTMALSHMPHLKVLMMESNDFNGFAEDNFFLLENFTLTYLSFRNCVLQYISPKSFSSLKIQTLDLSSNLLDFGAILNLGIAVKEPEILTLKLQYLAFLEVYPTIFFDLLAETSVESVDLSHKRFIYISKPEKVNEVLKELYLEECLLSSLENDVFAYFPNLEILSLRGNNFLSFPFSTLQVPPRLKYLHLGNSHSGIKINDFDLINYGHLETLNLSHSPLADTIRRNTFKNLTQLKTLDLVSTSIIKMEKFALESLVSLEHLYLQGNELEIVQPGMFAGLTSLIHLNISDNKITLVEGCFDYLPSLRILDMSRNFMLHVPCNISGRLPELSTLILDGNTLIPWEQRALANSKVRSLLLSKNSITYTTPVMIEDFKCLDLLDLSSNPFDCQGCQMYRLLEWISSNDTKLIKWDGQNETRSYVCYSPKAVKGRILKEVQLSKTICLNKDAFPKVVLYAFLIVLFLLIAISTILGYIFRGYVRYYSFLIRTSVKRYKEDYQSDSFTYDALISFSSEDDLWVHDNLLPELEEKQGFKLCLFARDIDSDLVGNMMMKTLNRCKKIIVILSQHYVGNNTWIEELNLIEDYVLSKKKDSLILVLMGPVEKVDLSENLLYLIKSRTHLRWSENVIDQKLFWARLGQSLKKPLRDYNIKQII